MYHIIKNSKCDRPIYSVFCIIQSHKNNLLKGITHIIGFKEKQRGNGYLDWSIRDAYSLVHSIIPILMFN